MACITINDAASIMTEVTTIFLGDQDDRYVALRADRKELSKAMNHFVLERRALMALTQEERDEDMEVEARFIDVDQERVYLAMNAWVRSAHGSLEVYNDYNRDMLGRIIACSTPFFTTQNNETTRNSCVLDEGQNCAVKKQQ